MAIKQEDDFVQALVYDTEGQYELAEKHYLKAIANHNISAMYNLALLYDNQAQYELAEKYYLMAIAKKNSLAMNNLALLYKQQEKYDLAENYYLMAIKQGYQPALFNLAVLYKTQDKEDLAEQYYLQAIEQGEFSAINNLALLYDNQEKYDLAEKYYLLAMEREAENSNILHNLAKLYENQEQYELAEKYYLLILSAENNVEVINSLAWLYFQTAKHKKQALDLAEKLSPLQDSPAIAYTLSCIYLWHNLFHKAEKIAPAFLFDVPFCEENDSDIILYLLLLLAKQQYHTVRHYFSEADIQCQRQFSFVYYALLKLTSHRENTIPLELKTTIQEITAEIEQLAMDYM